MCYSDPFLSRLRVGRRLFFSVFLQMEKISCQSLKDTQLSYKYNINKTVAHFHHIMEKPDKKARMQRLEQFVAKVNSKARKHQMKYQLLISHNTSTVKLSIESTEGCRLTGMTIPAMIRIICYDFEDEIVFMAAPLNPTFYGPFSVGSAPSQPPPKKRRRAF